MSSDESDPDTPGVFKIVNKPWRDAGLTTVFRTLDLIHKKDRARQRTGGAVFRTRVPTTGLETTRDPVRGLWGKAYCPRWWEQQSTIDKAMTAPRSDQTDPLGSVADLLGPMIITRYVTFTIAPSLGHGDLR